MTPLLSVSLHLVTYSLYFSLFLTLSSATLYRISLISLSLCASLPLPLSLFSSFCPFCVSPSLCVCLPLCFCLRFSHSFSIFCLFVYPLSPHPLHVPDLKWSNHKILKFWYDHILTHHHNTPRLYASQTLCFLFLASYLSLCLSVSLPLFCYFSLSFTLCVCAPLFHCRCLVVTFTLSALLCLSFSLCICLFPLCFCLPFSNSFTPFSLSLYSVVSLTISPI